ncbi:hypothetical protein [Actinoplanes sp. G11-F43]|uniref:hypothetical protein n=1 Tax=Actinoplanes sp. G11-F43 TaxID=3424130 RepID=UPI003D355331
MIIPPRWSRAEAIEVCLEAMATGRVHGFSPNHDPDYLAMNSSFTQSGLGRGSMVRDWGLFEAHFVSGRCECFVVQAHRMRKPPRWKKLRDQIEPYGVEPVAHLQVPGSEYFRVLASDSQICVDTESGRIMKISVAARPPLPGPVRPLPPGIRAAALRQRETWDGWLDRLPPDRWAGCLARMSYLHTMEPARRETWTAFGLWVLDRARAVWPADEWAWRWSDFVLDRPGSVPAGEIAAACLAALPMSRVEAAELPRDWRARTTEEIRLSRMTLALIRNAALDVPAPPPVPDLAAWRPLLRGLG